MTSRPLGVCLHVRFEASAPHLLPDTPPRDLNPSALTHPCARLVAAGLPPCSRGLALPPMMGEGRVRPAVFCVRRARPPLCVRARLWLSPLSISLALMLRDPGSDPCARKYVACEWRHVLVVWRASRPRHGTCDPARITVRQNGTACVLCDRHRAVSGSRRDRMRRCVAAARPAPPSSPYPPSHRRTQPPQCYRSAVTTPHPVFCVTSSKSHE